MARPSGKRGVGNIILVLAYAMEGEYVRDSVDP